jgi:hypothetical protein
MFPQSVLFVHLKALAQSGYFAPSQYIVPPAQDGAGVGGTGAVGITGTGCRVGSPGIGTEGATYVGGYGQPNPPAITVTGG